MRADPSMVIAYKDKGDDIYKKAEPFLNTLLIFQKVLNCCFGQKLTFNYKENPMHPELISYPPSWNALQTSQNFMTDCLGFSVQLMQCSFPTFIILTAYRKIVLGKKDICGCFIFPSFGALKHHSQQQKRSKILGDLFSCKLPKKC